MSWSLHECGLGATINRKGEPSISVSVEAGRPPGFQCVGGHCVRGVSVVHFLLVLLVVLVSTSVGRSAHGAPLL